MSILNVSSFLKITFFFLVYANIFSISNNIMFMRLLTFNTELLSVNFHKKIFLWNFIKNFVLYFNAMKVKKSKFSSKFAELVA